MHSQQIRGPQFRIGKQHVAQLFMHDDRRGILFRLFQQVKQDIQVGGIIGHRRLPSQCAVECSQATADVSVATLDRTAKGCDHMRR
jgi:hypothetical protein